MKKFDFTSPKALNKVKKRIDKEVKDLEHMQINYGRFGFINVFENVIKELN